MVTLEPRILADCTNRLLDSLNRISIYAITAALTTGAAVLSQDLLTAHEARIIAIYSYKVPLLVAALILGSFLAYLRQDYLDKLVLLRQLVTEQRCSSELAATIIPYHPWRYNPIFPAPVYYAGARVGHLEKFFWLYEFAIVVIAYAVFHSVVSAVGTVIGILFLKVFTGVPLFREIRRICQTLYPQHPFPTWKSWVLHAYLLPLAGTASVTGLVSICLAVGNKVALPAGLSLSW